MGEALLLALSFAEIPWSVVGALLLGGIVAAPLAAFVVRALPARILGLQLHVLNASTGRDFDAVFTDVVRLRWARPGPSVRGVRFTCPPPAEN